MFTFVRDFIDSPHIVFMLITYLLSILIAISFHEYSHALAATKYGDDTPRLTNRLSLNFLNHIDIIGFLSLLLFGFGWAKPVQINPIKFKDYRKGLLVTSIAGVFMNFILFVLSVLFLTILVNVSQVFTIVALGLEITTFLDGLTVSLYYLFSFSAQVNLCLMIFNLMPVPPLDGFNILNSYLPNRNSVIEFLSNYRIFFMLIGLVIINSFFADIFLFIYEPLFLFFNRIINLF